MDVSKNRGTPKWMVYNGKPYEQMDDLGGFPKFWVDIHIKTIVFEKRLKIINRFRDIHVLMVDLTSQNFKSGDADRTEVNEFIPVVP